MHRLLGDGAQQARDGVSRRGQRSAAACSAGAGSESGVNVWLGLFVYLDELHPEALSIGNNCTIGIRTTDHHALLLGAAAAGQQRHGGDRGRRLHRAALRDPAQRADWRRVGDSGRHRGHAAACQRRRCGAPRRLVRLATSRCPLTAAQGYAEFLRGLKPSTGITDRIGGNVQDRFLQSGSCGRSERDAGALALEVQGHDIDVSAICGGVPLVWRPPSSGGRRPAGHRWRRCSRTVPSRRLPGFSDR